MSEDTVTQKAESSMMEAVQAGIDKVLTTASVNAVFGKAVRQGDTLIIPAAEVLSFTGFGMGQGSGSAPARHEDGPTEPMMETENGPVPDLGGEVKTATGSGSGGGGGGQTFARPVAVIVAGPDGVEIKPVLDMTKIGLAALTTFGFMLATLARIRRGR